jgi:SAM-dependent methyltransferase
VKRPLRVHRSLRDLILIGLASGPAVLLLWGTLPVRPTIFLAFVGPLAAAAIALRSARDRKSVWRGRAGVEQIGAWELCANPAGNFANRWAMYQDLSEWLKSRDWRGKAVAELGHSNEVLRWFFSGARYTLLEYPDHDVQNLVGVPPRSFDLVILDQTLEHVADPERAMSEVARILKADGVALVTTPFLVPLHGTADYGDYTRWSPQGLARMLERHGFTADVRWWGNLAAARELLAHMHLKADEAMALHLPIRLSEREERFPITLWAVATLENGERLASSR